MKAGQPILALDKEATKSEYEKLKFQLESKRDNIQKLRLDLDKIFSEIKSNNDIKQLRINSLEAAVEDAKRLYKAGGGTRESVEQAELDLKVARREKQQLENEIRNKQQTMRLDIRESQIAAAIQENDLREMDRKLEQATITATRDGVVTWINKILGQVRCSQLSLIEETDASMSDYSTEGQELIPPKKNALLQISLKLCSPNRSLHFSDHQVTANLVKYKNQVNASWYFSQESHNGLLSYPILNSSLNRKDPENV